MNLTKIPAISTSPCMIFLRVFNFDCRQQDQEPVSRLAVLCLDIFAVAPDKRLNQ
jgi:hypothetical protein